MIGGGQMGQRVRDTDWSVTPLGAYDTWPQSLRSSLSLVLNAKGIAALYWGPQQWLLYNDAYGEALGDRHPWAFGRPMPEVLTDIAPVLGPQVAEVLRTGEGFAIESLSMVMHRHGRDEETVWTYSFSPVQGETGQFAGVLLLATEMTEQVKAQAALRAEREQFASLFEQAPTFMTMLSGKEHRFELANPAYMRLVGHRDILGKTVAEALPDAVEQGFLTILDRAYESGEAIQIDGIRYAVQAVPGGPYDERFVDVVWQPIRDANGAVGGIFIVGVDVTDRMHADAERELATASLRDLSETLEHRVAERTAELTRVEDALRQSQKMEAVGQLTGGLAHDFNNLLAGISGSLEMMQNRMQQGRFQDVERYMAVAQGASKRAAALTHRLLAFSRRQTLDPKPTDVNRLALGMQEMIQRTVGPSIPIEVVGAAGLWPALVDPSQLENALLNLCINARDAMPDGGRITVETANKWLDERAARQRDIPEGQYLSLCVTDTGIGMPPEVIARVFEPFFTTKPLGEGTGLGLSMIYGFAQQSGGQVRIYSEIGQGTTVCIYLPRHYGEIEDDEQSVKLDTLPRSEQGETVLVVDDEPSVRMLVTDILEDLGYTAIEAGDSAAGLKLLQSNVRIDLLVTDVGLPGGMNGRQMADAARVTRPSLKVLFITGYAENAILGNGHLAPGMAVLTKPFPIETMAARIRSMIEGGKEQARRS
ncbi:ATP-binding protein [Methylobacterium brachiatum]|uniref:histidine kinase n=2 Tax=Methylobacterium brachiatum TaxID=269660 RepID=A0ABV1RAL5_9HYPH